jgi:hypothetical protein
MLNENRKPASLCPSLPGHDAYEPRPTLHKARHEFADGLILEAFQLAGVRNVTLSLFGWLHISMPPGKAVVSWSVSICGAKAARVPIPRAYPHTHPHRSLVWHRRRRCLMERREVLVGNARVALILAGKSECTAGREWSGCGGGCSKGLGAENEALCCSRSMTTLTDIS